MFINGEKIVDNWGEHGAVVKEGVKMLNRGYHDIKVEFFQNGGGAVLEVKYKGADTGGNEKYLEGYHDPNE